MSDLPVNVFGHAAHVREIKNNPLPSASLHLFPSAPHLSQLSSIQAVQDLLIFGFEVFDVGGRLRVLFQESGARVVTGGEEGHAGVVGEEAVGEGEVACGTGQMVGECVGHGLGSSPSPTRRMRSSGLKGMVGRRGAACDVGLLAVGVGFAACLESLGGRLNEPLWILDRFVLGIAHVHMVIRVRGALILEVSG